MTSRSRFCRLGSEDRLSKDFAEWVRDWSETANRVARLSVSEQIAAMTKKLRNLPVLQFWDVSILILYTEPN